jgi:hypothetical protein
MNEYENEIKDCKQMLNVLLAQVKNAEKWVEYSKLTINDLREKLLNLEEKHGK